MHDAHYESAAIKREGWPFETFEQVALLAERLRRLVVDAADGAEVKIRISITQRNLTRKAQSVGELQAMADWVDLDVADRVSINVYHEPEVGARPLEVGCSALSLGRGGRDDWALDEVRLFTSAVVEAAADRVLLGPGVLGQVDHELDQAFKRKSPTVRQLGVAAAAPTPAAEPNTQGALPFPQPRDAEEPWYKHPLAPVLVGGCITLLAVVLAAILR